MSINLSIEPPKILSNGAWHGHVIFAQWLIKELNPATFVELGTHKGDSYFSFCQSVKKHKLKTKCYAVDSWEGESHAGFYGEDVYENVNKYNDENYSEFSKLYRSYFDDALDNFKDNSIDLLHIDGFHTYKAVSNDFNNWKKKLTANAVVIFHDTTEIRKDFGVWKFWEEIENRNRGKTFLFMHSHGLGILGIGDKYSDSINLLFESYQKDPQIFQDFFESINSYLIEPTERSLKTLKDLKFDIYINTDKGFSKNEKESNEIFSKEGRCKFFLRQYEHISQIRIDFGNYPKLIYIKNLRMMTRENDVEIPKIDNGSYYKKIELINNYFFIFTQKNPRLYLNVENSVNYSSIDFDYEILGDEKITLFEKEIEVENKINELIHDNEDKDLIINKLSNENKILTNDAEKIDEYNKKLCYDLETKVEENKTILKNTKNLKQKNEDLIEDLNLCNNKISEITNGCTNLELRITKYKKKINIDNDKIKKYKKKLKSKDLELFTINKDLEIKDNELKIKDNELKIKDNELKIKDNELKTKDNELVKLKMINKSQKDEYEVNNMIINENLKSIEVSMSSLLSNERKKICKKQRNNNAFIFMKRFIGFFIHPTSTMKYLNEKKIVTKSGLFDQDYYLDNRELFFVSDLIRHYILFGYKENKNPNMLFDCKYYLNEYPDVKSIGMNPFIHFLKYGLKENRNPHPLFNTSYYLSNNKDVQKSGINPLYHFIKYGGQEGRSPHENFDSEYYLNCNPDVRNSNVNPLIHYLKYGKKEGRSPVRNTKVVNENVKSKFKVTDKRSLVKSIPVNSKENEICINKSKNPNALNVGYSFLNNYLVMRQDIINSGFWDESWYITNYYNEYKNSEISSFQNFGSILDYYINVGWKLNHKPSDKFSLSNEYFSNDINPITYFLNTVRFEGYHFDKNVWGRLENSSEQSLKRIRKRKKHKVLYTCITGGYNSLIQLNFVSNDWDYICFTDDEELLKKKFYGIWELRKLQFLDDDLSISNRWHKMHPHILFKEYSESIYIDGNINILSDYLFNSIDTKNKDILIPRHFKRKCIYEEIATLKNSSRISEKNKLKLDEQTKFLERENFPKNFGLGENNILYRKHNKSRIIKMMDEWWSLLLKYSSRDQVSLAYLFWKNSMKIDNHFISNVRINYKDFWIVKHNIMSPGQYLEPAFEKNNIPIVFSTNDYFSIYLGVTIKSLIDNSTDDYCYDIIILERDLQEKSKKRISKINSKDNVSIRFFNMNAKLKIFDDDIFHVDGYVPPETYNKFFLTEILKNYTKCLYLDSDILILDDIANLYNIDLDGKSIGASLNLANINAAFCNKKIKGYMMQDYMNRVLGIEDYNTYFQAGILSINLKKLYNANLLQTCITKLKQIQKPIFFDQCIFNSVFNKDVKYFSTEWNHVWYMQKYSYLKYSIPREAYYDYCHGRVKPKIIHYASKDKPQNTPEWDLSSYFWKYARSMHYFDLIKKDAYKQVDDDNRSKLSLRMNDGGNRNTRLCIHFHLYYFDQIDFFIEKLSNIKIDCLDYDIFVTLNRKNIKAETKIKDLFPNAKFMICKNIGYDIYPFLQVLKRVRLDEYDYILKIHTKNKREVGKDIVYGNHVPGFTWRNELVDSLIESKEKFSENINVLNNSKDVACIGSEKYIFDIRENNEETVYNMKKWQNELNIKESYFYIGGSMFLARAYPFERLKDLNVNENNFDNGASVTKDYKNMAHVVERLLGLVIGNEGFKIYGIESL